MTLQCTKSAGHWKVGRGTAGVGVCLRSEGGAEVKPPPSSSVESPPHSGGGGVTRPHFAEDAVEAQRGEGTCPRLYIWS